ncbi:MAG: DUF2207 domain-containing protein [Bacteroidetes bacterium]|nr:DUF2207 domain-containing protein [Bacteroidota bacterium]
MRYRITFVFLLIFLGQSFAQKEYINLFDVVLEVDTAGTYTVTETISVMANGDRIKRGIFRSLPLTRGDNNGRRYPIAYTIESVLQDGNPATYHTEEKGGFFHIYIGDANVFIKPGFHTYKIRYKTYGQVGYFEDFDEVYWNVNGTEWAFPCIKVQAEIILPEGAKLQSVNCYTGTRGSTAQDCTIEDGPGIRFSAENLDAYENLTIVADFNKGILAAPPPLTFLRQNRYLIIGLLAGLGLLIYYVFTWMKYGVDPQKPAVYPVFDPPENLSPAAVGIFDKDRIQSGFMTASLVNLAVKGFIKITESSKKGLFSFITGAEYTLTRVKKVDDSLAKEERSILEQLFDSDTKVVLDGEYNSDVYSARVNFVSRLKDQYSSIIDEGRNTKFLTIPILVTILFLIVSVMFREVMLPPEIFHFLSGGAIFLVAATVVILPLLSAISKKAKKYFIWAIPLILFGFIAWRIIQTPASDLNMLILVGFVCFALTSIIVYRYLIQQPTKEKLRMQSLVEGFKMYMGAAENNQLRQFNPPEMTPERFERLLPYAIALGVEDVWGQKFQSFLEKSGTLKEYHSHWYVGSRPFSPNLYHSINSSVANGISSTATKPSESGGGSWSSGGGGGGFSGGGGGGGGGGGW